MKIGLLSDSHSKVAEAKNAIETLIENGAEFIIHAGDICRYETLEILKNCGKQYIAVYGNNDASLVQYHNEFNLVQEPYYFKLAETKFKLMHLPFYMTPDAEVVISGHTHMFHSEFKKGTLFLNPGEICMRNKDAVEFSMLEVTPKKFEVTYYMQTKKKLKSKEFSYKRKK